MYAVKLERNRKMYGDTNKKHYSEPKPFVCPYCGHNEAQIDSFAQIPTVKRITPGNLICAKCKKAVPAIATT